jgi:hypothetical protein
LRPSPLHFPSSDPSSHLPCLWVAQRNGRRPWNFAQLTANGGQPLRNAEVPSAVRWEVTRRRAARCGGHRRRVFDRSDLGRWRFGMSADRASRAVMWGTCYSAELKLYEPQQ